MLDYDLSPTTADGTLKGLRFAFNTRHDFFFPLVDGSLDGHRIRPNSAADRFLRIICGICNSASCTYYTPFTS